jgi:hypothetical protein
LIRRAGPRGRIAREARFERKREELVKLDGEQILVG